MEKQRQGRVYIRACGIDREGNEQRCEEMQRLSIVRRGKGGARLRGAKQGGALYCYGGAWRSEAKARCGFAMVSKARNSEGVAL